MTVHVYSYFTNISRNNTSSHKIISLVKKAAKYLIFQILVFATAYIIFF